MPTKAEVARLLRQSWPQASDFQNDDDLVRKYVETYPDRASQISDLSEPEGRGFLDTAIPAALRVEVEQS